MHENRISVGQRFAREIATPLERLLLPTKVIHVGNGMGKARRLRATEGRDILSITTHPSKTDEPREYAYFWSKKEFANGKVIVPNAADQDTEAVRSIAAMLGIDTYPIVTSDVKKRDHAEEREVGWGNLSYYKRVIRSSGDKENSNIIFLAPDAGRRPVLQTPSTRAAEFLATAASKNTHGGNFVIVFMGVEINGVDDYTKAEGSNIGKEYTIRIGDAFTNQELLEEIQMYRMTHDLLQERPDRPYQHLEKWIYETQFPILVPNSYREK